MAQVGVLDPSAAPAGTRKRLAAQPRTEPSIARWLVLIGFAVVTALGIRAHTPWFDEVQAWNIARASHSLGDLAANLRYEGHPILWYLPLFVLTRFTRDPHAMQVLQFAIAVSTAALILFRAPLRFALRVALLAGYFFAFEYGVFSRSYGLSALLVVTALVQLARPAPRWASATAALVALAFTSLPGAALAVAIAVTVLLDRRFRRVACARALGALVIVVAGLVAIACIPPDDFGNLTPGIGDSSRFGSGIGVRLASSASATWRALVPLPPTVGEWNTNLLDRLPGAVWLEAVLSLVLIAVVLTALRHNPFARRLWLVGSLALFAFFVVVTRPEAVRHAGYVFLLFVACVWLASAAPGESTDGPIGERARGSELLGTLVVVVLAAQVVGTVMVYPPASTRDFSRDASLASAVHDAGLDDRIVSAQDWDGTTIGGYLGTSVFSLARGEQIEYLVTDRRQELGMAALNVTTVTCAAIELANRRGRSVALVVNGELPRLEPLIVRGASIYEVAPQAEPPECNA